MLASACQSVETPAEQTESVPGHLLIRGATLIDGTGADPRPGVDVLVADGVIQEIGSNLSAPEAEVIDASGKYVIPGMIDTHVHLDAPMVFQLTPEEKQQIIDHTPKAFLYNGITTVLNLSSDADWIWAQRQAQREGTLLAPRIYAMGRSFTPENGWGSRHGGALTTPEQAEKRLEEYIAAGTDGVKVMIENGLGDSNTYAEMPDDILQAIAKVAHENNVPIYVHAINLHEYKRALAIDPRGIMHGLEDPIPEGDPLIQQIVSKKVYIVPTLSLFESFLHFDELPGGWDNPVLKGSVPGFLLAKLQQKDYFAEENRRFKEVARMPVYEWVEKALPIFRENVRKMHEAGIVLGTGTDAGGPVGYNFQGYNTPWELELLVDCGLTPMEALQAATQNGAQIIGISDKVGTVESGKWADLLILRANPLEDIENVRQIDTVILNGKSYSRNAFAAE